MLIWQTSLISRTRFTFAPEGEDFQRVATRLNQPATPNAVIVHELPTQNSQFIRIVTHGHKGQVFDSFSRITEVQAFLN